MRSIAHFMTKQPWSVQLDDSLAVARQMLAAREVHHMPVLDNDKVVGMIVARDLIAAVDRAATAESVMSRAHEVDADTAFSEVLESMAAQQCDAVVITKAGRIEGIFTAMDAVRLLYERMRPRVRKTNRVHRPRHGARA
jgi:acetoin utilization protein AcuB